MSLKLKAKNAINLLRSKEQIPIPQPINEQKMLKGKVADVYKRQQYNLGKQVYETA